LALPVFGLVSAVCLQTHRRNYTEGPRRPLASRLEASGSMRRFRRRLIIPMVAGLVLVGGGWTMICRAADGPGHPLSLLVADFRTGTRTAPGAYYGWPATIGLRNLGARSAAKLVPPNFRQRTISRGLYKWIAFPKASCLSSPRTAAPFTALSVTARWNPS
jgi:hypothetical protein